MFKAGDKVCIINNHNCVWGQDCAAYCIDKIGIIDEEKRWYNRTCKIFISVSYNNSNSRCHFRESDLRLEKETQYQKLKRLEIIK